MNDVVDDVEFELGDSVVDICVAVADEGESIIVELITSSSPSSIVTSFEGGEYTYVGVAIGSYVFDASVGQGVSIGYGIRPLLFCCVVGSDEGLNVGELIVCAIDGAAVVGA